VLLMLVGFWFFFSSRRRHTRSKRDWSSDVCSSDLILFPLVLPELKVCLSPQQSAELTDLFLTSSKIHHSLLRLFLCMPFSYSFHLYFHHVDSSFSLVPFLCM